MGKHTNLTTSAVSNRWVALGTFAISQRNTIYDNTLQNVGFVI